ncbi:MAG: hypothetical protein ACOCG5_01055 [Candidatus Alkaliphilus sp. MAG34]
MDYKISNENVIFETIKIIVTVLATGFFTHYLSFRSDIRKKKYKSKKELLENVLSPVMNIINSKIYPGSGYEGLDYSQINEIIEIVEKSIHHVEPKLESFCWQFKEELIYENYRHDGQAFIHYDEDGKFLGYIGYHYNKIRKQLYLPYDSYYFLYPKIKRKFRMFKYSAYRKFRKYFVRQKTKK